MAETSMLDIPQSSKSKPQAASGRSPIERALDQPFNLGLFLPIHKGGWTPSAIPRETDWRFAYNSDLTRRAEAAGFDLVFALAQWLSKGGMGGKIEFRDNSLESFMTVASLAPVTSRIMLISTVHVLYGPWHPLFLAKMGATLDHISGGRWGINVVTGSRPQERPMFGLPPIDHDLRYDMIAEFADIIDRLWTIDENLTFDGRFWKTQDAYVSPRPTYRRPVMVNAGNSMPSQRYAARYSDFIFITSPAGAEIDAALDALPALHASIREQAAAAGRPQLRSIINPMVICRETEAEARDIYNRTVEMGDPEAASGMMVKGDAQSWRGHTQKQRVVGGNIHLVGTPEQVVDQMLKLKKAGCGGIQLTFIDFQPELEFFIARVLPLMHQAGLRISTDSG